MRSPFAHLVLLALLPSRPRARSRRTGSAPRATVRRLRSDESGTVQEVFDGMGTEARRMRYLVATPRLTGHMRRRLAGIHPDWHVVVVAEIHGTPVGLGRFVRTPSCPERAEVAVEVVDRWVGRGIGRQLLDHVLREAGAAGVGVVTASVLPENKAMIGLLRARRAVLRRVDGLVEVELPLDTARVA